MSSTPLLLVPTLFLAMADEPATRVASMPPAGDLESFRWAKRVLLVRAKCGNELLDKLVLRWSETHILLAAEERHLLLLWVPAAEAQAFQVSLIGKDGGVKGRWSEPVAPEEVFALVDSMPMRQREMQAARQQQQ